MSLISPNFDVKLIIFSQFWPGAFSQNCWKKPCLFFLLNTPVKAHSMELFIVYIHVGMYIGIILAGICDAQHLCLTPVNFLGTWNY